MGLDHSPGMIAALVLFQMYLLLYQATSPSVLFLSVQRMGSTSDRRAIPALTEVAERAGEDPRARERALLAIRRILEVNGDGDVYRNAR